MTLKDQNRWVSFIATCNNIDPGKQVIKAFLVPGGMPPGTNPGKKK